MCIKGKSFTILFLYINDFLIIDHDHIAISDPKPFLHSHFQISDLGDLKFLSFDIKVYCSKKYTLEIVKDGEYLGIKSLDFSMEQNINLLDEGELIKDLAIYTQFVGRLICLTITHSNISLT